MWPVGHICFALIIGNITATKYKLNWNRYISLAAIFFSLLPDVDILIFGWEYHGGITHTVWFLLGCTFLVFLMTSVIYKTYRRSILLATILGIGTHLIADMIVGVGGLRVFYPYFSIPISLSIWPFLNSVGIGFYQMFRVFEGIMALVYVVYKLVLQNPPEVQN